jgi:hypothetical protein
MSRSTNLHFWVHLSAFFCIFRARAVGQCSQPAVSCNSLGPTLPITDMTCFFPAVARRQASWYPQPTDTMYTFATVGHPAGKLVSAAWSQLESFFLGTKTTQAVPPLTL